MIKAMKWHHKTEFIDKQLLLEIFKNVFIPIGNFSFFTIKVKPKGKSDLTIS